MVIKVFFNYAKSIHHRRRSPQAQVLHGGGASKGGEEAAAIVVVLRGEEEQYPVGEAQSRRQWGIPGVKAQLEEAGQKLRLPLSMCERGFPRLLVEDEHPLPGTQAASGVQDIQGQGADNLRPRGYPLD